MKTGIFILFFTLIGFYAHSQDEFLLEVNKLLDENEVEISEKKNKIRVLKSQLEGLVKDNSTKDFKLKESIQKWHYANLELEKKEVEVQKITERYSSVLVENNSLKIRIAQLNQQLREIQTVRKKENEYKKELSQNMRWRGKSKIFEDAIQSANSDFQNGKSRTSIGIFNRGEPFLFFNTGYRIAKGTEFNLSTGLVANQDGNIFIGLGAGYQFLQKEEQALIPLYTSFKIALGWGFLDSNTSNQNQIENVEFLYVIADLGYSFTTGNNEKSLKGGFFTNIGLGCPFFVSENLAVDAGVSWRRQKVNRQITNTLNVEFINTVDLRIGLEIYLGR